jgi:hypothetical protein
MRYPYHHISSHLHPKELVLVKKDISSTTCSISYLTEVSLHLILRPLLYWITQWYRGIKSILLTINPMGYSYWTSVLNWMFYIHPVITTLRLQRCPHLQSNYDIPLAYSSSKIWSRRMFKPKHPTLSYFRSLFNDHMRPTILNINTLYGFL